MPGSLLAFHLAIVMQVAKRKLSCSLGCHASEAEGVTSGLVVTEITITCPTCRDDRSRLKRPPRSPTSHLTPGSHAQAAPSSPNSASQRRPYISRWVEVWAAVSPGEHVNLAQLLCPLRRPTAAKGGPPRFFRPTRLTRSWQAPGSCQREPEGKARHKYDSHTCSSRIFRWQASKTPRRRCLRLAHVTQSNVYVCGPLSHWLFLHSSARSLSTSVFPSPGSSCLRQVKCPVRSKQPALTITFTTSSFVPSRRPCAC